MPGKVSLKTVISDKEEIATLRDLYEECMIKQNARAAQKQICFTEEEFDEAMRDSEWLKFLIYDEQNLLIGLGLTTFNIKKAEAAYIDSRVWIEEGKKQVYVVFMGTKPSHQGQGYTQHFMEQGGAQLIGKFGADIVSFDYSEKLHPELHNMVLHVLPQMGFQAEEVDCQHYVKLRIPKG